MSGFISLDYPHNNTKKLSNRLLGVPKRYEETRPVKIQNFTHHRIIDIGNQVHNQALLKLQEETRYSIEEAEKNVWQQAAGRETEAIEKVKQRARHELEIALKKQQKEHEQKLKEETLRVEMEMQKLNIEQIKKERATAQVLIKASVKDCEEKSAKQQILAIESARKEEREIAKASENKLLRIHAKEIEELEKRLMKEKEKELKELGSIKDAEIQEAVDIAINKEIEHKKQELKLLQEEFQVELNKIKIVIHEKNQIIEDLKQEIAQIEVSKEKLKGHLQETREEFQAFINRCQYFDQGQSDFLLPSVNFDQFEN